MRSSICEIAVGIVLPLAVVGMVVFSGCDSSDPGEEWPEPIVENYFQVYTRVDDNASAERYAEYEITLLIISEQEMYIETALAGNDRPGAMLRIDPLYGQISSITAGQTISQYANSSNTTGLLFSPYIFIPGLSQEYYNPCGSTITFDSVENGIYEGHIESDFCTLPPDMEHLGSARARFRFDTSEVPTKS
jgi:hypothetical protein